MLAARFDQEIDIESMTGLIAAGWTKDNIDWICREHGGWWQPWRIRASSGHSDFGFARPAELCNMLFPNMSDRLGGAYHVTKPSALEGIILRGIVPRGNDSARRLAVHFGVFAPWDSENISTKTAMHDVKEGDDLIAMYMLTRSGGTTIAFETIPFKEVRAIWRFKSVKKGPVKDVRRIYSRVVESEICPGFKDAVGVTPADCLGNLNSFLDDEDSADADILKKMVVTACVNIGVPETLNKSLVESRDLLSRFIVYREDDPSSIPTEYAQRALSSFSRGILLLHGMRMWALFHRQVRDPFG